MPIDAARYAKDFPSLQFLVPEVCTLAVFNPPKYD
jgi:hypothetical protein